MLDCDSVPVISLTHLTAHLSYHSEMTGVFRYSEMTGVCLVTIAVHFINTHQLKCNTSMIINKCKTIQYSGE